MGLATRGIIQTALAWRLEHGYGKLGGVVILLEGFAIGWMNSLRNPDHWEPGTLAVDADGHTWRAVGGNDSDGAALWMPTNFYTWRHMKAQRRMESKR